MVASSAKGKQRGEQSRERILDTAERLMAVNGYAATSISAICAESGLRAPSIYWHFGSKEGLLAAVMDRGAQRWFESLPRWDDLPGEAADRVDRVLDAGADAVASHPAFLRLFYMLALDSGGDPSVAELVRKVRRKAFMYFAEAIEYMIAPSRESSTARRAAQELARFAVAQSDGCFFALQLEPDEVDARQMYRDLAHAVVAIAPAVIARVRAEEES